MGMEMGVGVVAEEGRRVRFDRDGYPELKDRAIKLCGYVGRAKCVFDPVKDEYRLVFPEGGKWSAAIEVFPDTAQTSTEGMVYFMVLAMTKWEVEDDDMEGESEEDVCNFSEGPAEENSEDEIEDNAEGEIGVETEEGEKETEETYDGVGIILEPGPKQNHFYHIGALEVAGLGSSVLEAIQHREESDILGGCDKDGKYKIWLN